MTDIKDKTFFIVEQYNAYDGKRFSIHDRKMYDLTTAVRKLLALDTLNEDKERTSYHLQEVSFSAVDKPLVLTDEVKEDKNWKECIDESLPF
mgnify:CR=1 FL=1